MAQINFICYFQNTVNDLAGSGLGFYGSGGFGSSVNVGSFQDNTFITDSTGALQGPKANNVKYVHSASGDLGGGDVRVLQGIPNQLATVNIRFTHTSAIKTQNAQMRIFDRVNINVPATGVTTYAAQVIHPWATASPLGSGDTTWKHLGGSGGTINGVTYDAPLSLVNSPGLSGLSPSGSNTVSTQHDWYVLLSASPDAIGSKSQYGLWASLEYL
jgi:hypothetical protein